MIALQPSRSNTGRPLRTLSAVECEALGKRVLGMVSAPRAVVSISHSAYVGMSFVNGDMQSGSDSTKADIRLTVDLNGKRGETRTSQLDDAGLRTLVMEAEAVAREHRGPEMPLTLIGPQRYPVSPQRFFDSVPLAATGESRAALCGRALDISEAAGVVSSGNVDFTIGAEALMNSEGLATYDRYTWGGLSLTARTKNGKGSGWATDAHPNWARIDSEAVMRRAVSLAERSANPVAVEPGRYTVILEPAAVSQLVTFIEWGARPADDGYTVFSKSPRGTNKIGLQMLDDRFKVIADPWDPENPTTVWDQAGYPITTPKIWFDRGVLRDLYYYPAYARQKNREPVFAHTERFRLMAEGPTTSLDEMIASTKRGIWVNRVDGIQFMNYSTMLLTGTTRDGTFLIENGKITKAIKNFRFVESPFFVLNKLEAFGEPMRTGGLVVAPRLKVRDFDFTSLTDAI